MKGVRTQELERRKKRSIIKKLFLPLFPVPCSLFPAI